MPRGQANSAKIGGKNSEKAVRALTPTPHGGEGHGHNDPTIKTGDATDCTALPIT
jgi:hypothetical protein